MHTALNILLDTVIGLSVLVILWCAIQMYRVSKVYTYRIGLINKIHVAAIEDIKQNRVYWWRYDVFDTVSFNTMCFHFWRHLDSFYPDKGFIDKMADGGER